MISTYSNLQGGFMAAKPQAKDAKAVSLGSWLQEQRLTRGLTRPEAVNEGLKVDPRAQLSPDYLSKLEYGTRSLASAAADVREAIRRGLGISREEWISATGLHIPLEAHDGVVKLADDGLIEVPVYGMASANPDGNMTATKPVGTARIPSTVIRENRHAYLVLGDSMDDGGRDGIRDGDTVMCDHSATDLREGKIYIVKVPGNGILLKRVRTYADGETYLESDNRNYRPLRPDEAQIIGRVVWVDPKGFAP